MDSIVKVLLFYHSGAMPNAHCIFRELAKSESIELTAVVPEAVQVDRVFDSSGWLRAGRETSADGYRYLSIPLRDPCRYVLGFDRKAMRKVLRDAKPDIIQVLAEPTSRYLSQVIWERLPICPSAKVLFYGFENLPIQFRGIRSWLKWRATWQQVAGGAAANSEVFAQLSAAGFPRGRILERIFWGISTEVFRPMNREVVKSQLKLNHEHIVGFVGRLVDEKGVLDLLKAIQSLPSSVHGVFIGSGPLKAALENQGRIHAFDVMPPEQLASYLNCMNVIAVPSLTTSHWKEQYGRVIAEAMACGVPVVGSDSGAIPEVIDDAGIIVPEHDVPGLTKAIHQAIFNTEIRERLRQHGSERAEREFSAHTMARRLTSLYNKVLKN